MIRPLGVLSIVLLSSALLWAQVHIQSQTNLDGMLEIRDHGKAHLVIEGNAARVLFGTIHGTSKVVENAQDDCSLQRIRIGVHLTCGHCEAQPDSAAHYWCSMNIDSVKGEVLPAPAN